jgi:hypothetical protein
LVLALSLLDPEDAPWIRRMLPGFDPDPKHEQSNHCCNDFGRKEKMQEEREDVKGMRERCIPPQIIAATICPC